MPNGSVTLMPGVNVERTLALNEAGISQSQLVRFKDSLVQTYGGWSSYGVAAVGSTVRDLHAWIGVSGDMYLAAGATANLVVLTETSNTDITPQTLTTNIAATSFSISSGSNSVTVVDPNSGPTTFNRVFFNTPVAIGNLLLNGAYSIAIALSTGSYQILSSIAATTTITSSGILPKFSTSSGSAVITVTLPNNNFVSLIGLQQTFYAPTTVGGLTVQGAYTITSIIDSTSFTINGSELATTTASSISMNSSLAQLKYYITAGPQALAAGFGAGGFGDGGFGTGVAFSGTIGTAITATDWSMDNWGEVLLACPEDGPIFAWSPNSGYYSSQVIAEAPFFNGGIFVSMPQQILVAWRSCQSTGTQDNLIVRWCDAGDYTNWTVAADTSAGSFKITPGSIIMGGLQAPNFGVIWTDINVWIMQYIGGDATFNFTSVGSGCGLVGQHACGVINGSVYWCGKSNFYTISGGGVQTIPCTVWDYIFQNLNDTNARKIQCAPNSAFNEIAWFFPSENSTENDSYVKHSINDGVWDYGNMSRTAWIDVSILGTPIGSDSGGSLWQHESGTETPGASDTFFRSGWWAITEGSDIPFVDFVMPDFIWGEYSAAQTTSVDITFYSVDYPGDTPRTHGPYTITRTTQFVSPRIRGRLMSVLVQSNSQTFWRLGKIRFRYGVSGRR